MNQKVKYLIVTITLILLIIIIRSTYSKYTSTADAAVVEKIGQWIINVNNTDVSNILIDEETSEIKTVNFDINSDHFKWTESDHVAPRKSCTRNDWKH